MRHLPLVQSAEKALSLGFTGKSPPFLQKANFILKKISIYYIWETRFGTRLRAGTLSKRKPSGVNDKYGLNHAERQTVFTMEDLGDLDPLCFCKHRPPFCALIDAICDPSRTFALPGLRS